jgi:hypothetical protein
MPSHPTPNTVLWKLKNDAVPSWHALAPGPERALEWIAV